MKPIRMLGAFVTVGGWTLLSRLLGFIRDVMIAAFLGAGPVAEAFLIAFALPNMFRRFFAEGAFNTAFVPMFAKRIETGEDAQSFANSAAGVLGLLLIALCLLALVFMPWLVWAMASGFEGDERFSLAVGMGRIVFVYILFISLAALASGVLNALGRFAAAAAAPVLLNVILVAFMLLAPYLGLAVGDALAWGVPVAGVAQLGMVWFAARRAGFTIVPRLRFSPALKRLAIVAAPAALAGGVVQVNLLVGRQVASFTDGAIAWLSYADRLYQLPLGVVGIAIGVVLLPELSRRLAAGDGPAGQAALNRAAEFALLLALPAGMALLVVPHLLVSVLFERGAFMASDTSATALAVAIYGLGLPAFVLQKVAAPLFFAREDTRRPFYYALCSMLVNLVLAVGLMPWLGYLAAPVATGVAGWAMLGLLLWGARGYGVAAQMDARLRRRVPRQMAAALVMGLGVWLLGQALAPWLDGGSGARFAALGLVVLTGAVVYGGVLVAIGGAKLSDLRQPRRQPRA
ncbi:murein biosynthesis integral membrane protein MurJ [Abyssibius alkaniclasticus]|uniref:murein biosynthesis integral membrane protein MurJ n=1 Tax=Abyssibius alkaniclasticus TaxID=2881234 RepID=UPI002363521B|nr:murein biosynthesis integral membrane protein MurJ [Abyssibius alkaniclasticus]UPH71253.1 murein biosynthesis integral membrane protein MurJ [Abyssibius alkaniclasticus]